MPSYQTSVVRPTPASLSGSIRGARQVRDNTIQGSKAHSDSPAPILGHAEDYDMVTGAATWTQAITVEAGVSTLIVCLEYGSGTTVNAQTMTYDGVSMTRLGDSSSGTNGLDRRLTVWVLDNPTVGTLNLFSTINFSTFQSLVATTWFDLDTAALIAIAEDVSSGTAVTTLSTLPLVYPYLSFVGMRSTSTPTASADQIILGNHFSGGNHVAAVSYQVAGSIASWTWSVADRAAVIGFPLPYLLKVESATAVGKDLQVIWNDNAVVNDNLQVIWNDRAVIADTLQVVWNDNAVIADNLGLVWNNLTSVSDTLLLIWNDAFALQDNLQLIWNVLEVGTTPVGKDLQVIWNMNVVVADNLQIIWNDRAVIADVLQLVWNNLAVVNDNLQVIWNDRALVNDNLQLIWNDRALVTDNLQLIWNDNSLVADNLQLIWNDRAVVSDQLQLIWNTLEIVLTAVGDTLQLIWNVRTPVADDLSLRWNVLRLEGWIDTPVASGLWTNQPVLPEAYTQIPTAGGIYTEQWMFSVVDNGDGTWTITARDDIIQMLDSMTFTLTSDAVYFIDSDTYAIIFESAWTDVVNPGGEWR